MLTVKLASWQRWKYLIAISAMVDLVNGIRQRLYKYAWATICD
jgi:hypothetical protein